MWILMKLNLFFKLRFKSDWIPVIIIFIFIRGFKHVLFPPKTPQKNSTRVSKHSDLLIHFHLCQVPNSIFNVYLSIHPSIHPTSMCPLVLYLLWSIFSEAWTKISHMILFFLKAKIICVTGSIMSCNFLKFVFAIEFSLSKVDEDVLGRRMFSFLCSPTGACVSWKHLRSLHSHPPDSITGASPVPTCDMEGKVVSTSQRCSAVWRSRKKESCLNKKSKPQKRHNIAKNGPSSGQTAVEWIHTSKYLKFIYGLKIQTARSQMNKRRQFDNTNNTYCLES